MRDKILTVHLLASTLVLPLNIKGNVGQTLDLSALRIKSASLAGVVMNQVLLVRGSIRPEDLEMLENCRSLEVNGLSGIEEN